MFDNVSKMGKGALMGAGKAGKKMGMAKDLIRRVKKENIGDRGAFQPMKESARPTLPKQAFDTARGSIMKKIAKKMAK